MNYLKSQALWLFCLIDWSVELSFLDESQVKENVNG